MLRCSCFACVSIQIVKWPLSCIQDHTRVGSADSQDIQLCGMAIQAEHCVIDVTESHGVVLTPHRNAKYVASPWQTILQKTGSLRCSQSCVQFELDCRSISQLQTTLSCKVPQMLAAMTSTVELPPSTLVTAAVFCLIASYFSSVIVSVHVGYWSHAANSGDMDCLHLATLRWF